jgi:hypothetical protein
MQNARHKDIKAGDRNYLLFKTDLFVSKQNERDIDRWLFGIELKKRFFGRHSPEAMSRAKEKRSPTHWQALRAAIRGFSDTSGLQKILSNCNYRISDAS